MKKSKNVMLNIITFYFLISILPIIDFINGLLITYNLGVPIGTAYRTIFILFLVLSIFLLGLKLAPIIILNYFVVVSILVLLLLQTIFNTGSYFFLDLQLVLRTFLIILIPTYLYNFKNYVNIRGVENVIKGFSVLFPMLLLVPFILGIGNSTYGAGGGYKGFFYATNDITLVFIILNVFTGSKLFESINNQKSFMVNLVVYFINFSCIILIGTKTGILFAVIFLLWLIYRYVLKNEKIAGFNKLKIFIFGIPIVIIVGFIVINFFSEPLKNTIERFNYFYKIYGHNMIQFLTSSRSEFLLFAKQKMSEESNYIFRMLFGNGFNYRFEFWGIGDYIEMDWMDLYFSMGLFGVIILFLYFFPFFIQVKKNASKSWYEYSFILIIIYSFFAGHVFFSALPATMLGVICGLMVLKKSQNEG